MANIESVLITGANAGLGKEAARLMALRPETKRVLMGFAPTSPSRRSTTSSASRSGRSRTTSTR